MGEPSECNLFGRLGIWVQIILFWVCSLALLFKRQKERPRRKFLIFTLDTSKQMIAQITVHFLNIFISHQVQHECSEYLFVSTFDTIFGLIVNYVLLKIFNWFAELNDMTYLVAGNYFEEISTPAEEANLDAVSQGSLKARSMVVNYRLWLAQTMVWCTIVFLSKLLMYMAEMRLQIMVDICHIFLLPLPTPIKIVFVLIIMPAVLNATMVWVQDNLLKRKQATSEQELKEHFSQFYEEDDVVGMELTQDHSKMMKKDFNLKITECSGQNPAVST